MTLFCKQCDSRRLPEYHEAEKQTLWLCKKCQNFANGEDVIVREQTGDERKEVKRKLEEFEKTTNFPKGKLVRRKGVN
jgi:ribosomal protein L37AE/L43A